MGPRHLQERLGGDVQDSSGPTLDGVVANTTVPGFRACQVLLVNPISKDKKMTNKGQICIIPSRFSNLKRLIESAIHPN